MKQMLINYTSLGVALLSGSLAAHHGDAGRYTGDVSTVTGVVVALQLINPHSVVIFDVEDADGNSVRWRAEMGSPKQLADNFGWNKQTLTVGSALRITGRVAKSGAPYINLTEKARIVLLETCEEIYHSRTLPDGPPDCS